MNAIAEAFRVSGPWLYILVGVAFLTHPLALVGGLLFFTSDPPNRGLTVFAVLCALGAALAIAVAGVGLWTSTGIARDALEAAAPEFRQKVVDAVATERAALMVGGLITAAFPALMSLALFARNARAGRG